MDLKPSTRRLIAAFIAFITTLAAEIATLPHGEEIMLWEIGSLPAIVWFKALMFAGGVHFDWGSKIKPQILGDKTNV